MMILAQIGDTPDKIAARFKGHRAGKKEFAQAIREENKNTLAWRAFSGDFYASRYPLWIPTKRDPAPLVRQLLVSTFQGMPEQSLDAIDGLLHRHIDPLVIAHAQSLAAYANQRMVTGKHAKDFTWLGVVADKSIELVDAGLHDEGEHLKKFADCVDRVTSSLAAYQGLDKVRDVSEELNQRGDAVKQEFQSAFAEMKTTYQADLHRFAMMRDEMYYDYRDFEYLALKESMIIVDTKEVYALARMGRYLKFLGNGFIVVPVIEDIEQIKYAYEHHGHWIRDTIEDTLKIGAMVLIGFGVGLIFTGGGWVVVAAAGTEVGLNIGADYVIDKLGNKLDQ